MDDYTNELCIADTTGDYWYILALKLKFPEIKIGQVVRMRSVNYDSTSKNKKVY